MLTAKPRPDETLMGFVLRVAARNCYETPSYLLQLSRLGNEQFVRNCSFVFGQPSDFTLLAYLTGTETAELAALGFPPATPGNPTTEYLFFASPIGKYFIRTVHNKICPACLQESNYSRKTWDLAGVTACPTHKLLLLDQCQNCKRHITWNRKGVNICSCEFDFRDSDSPTVAESDILLAKHIYRLCGLSPFEAGSKEVANNPLTRLPLRDFLSLIFFVAGQYQNTLDTKGRNTATRQRNAEVHSLLTKAFSVFEDWPHNYFEFLAWRQQHDANDSRGAVLHSGLLKDFGSFYRGLYCQYKTAQYDFLRVAFSGYLSQRWRGGYISALNRHTAVSSDLEDKRFMTRNEARRALKISRRRLDRFIEVGRLKAVVKRQSRRRLFLVDAEDVKSLKRELEHSLSLQEVRKRLGIERQTFQRLVRHGIVEALGEADKHASKSPRFDEGVVEDLFDKIRAFILRPAFALAGDELSLTATHNRLKMSAPDLSLAGLIAAVIRGEIRPCGEIDDAGISRFLFNRGAIEAYAGRIVGGNIVRKTVDRRSGE